MLYRTGLTEHPSNHVPSQTEDEDQGLQPIDRRQHHNTERGNRLALLDDQVEQVPDLLTHMSISQRQGGPFPVLMVRTYATVTGEMMVLKRSMKTIARIPKKPQKPHNPSIVVNSTKL